MFQYKTLGSYERLAKPLQIITCPSLRGIDSKSFFILSSAIFVHIICKAFFKSSALFMSNFNSLLSTMDHTFSIMFKSGLFAGQESCLRPFLFKYYCVIAETWGPSLSCWYKSCWTWWDGNFWNAVGRLVSSISMYLIKLRRPSSTTKGPRPWHLMYDQTPIPPPL